MLSVGVGRIMWQLHIGLYGFTCGLYSCTTRYISSLRTHHLSGPWVSTYRRGCRAREDLFLKACVVSIPVKWIVAYPVDVIHSCGTGQTTEIPSTTIDGTAITQQMMGRLTAEHNDVGFLPSRFGLLSRGSAVL